MQSTMHRNNERVRGIMIMNFIIYYRCRVHKIKTVNVFTTTLRDPAHAIMRINVNDRTLKDMIVINV